mgnify:CR=1 FL=1
MSDVLPSCVSPVVSLLPGLRAARRHLLLYARMQRLGARWLRHVYPKDMSQLDRAKRKIYKAGVARLLARDLKKMEATNGR